MSEAPGVLQRTNLAMRPTRSQTKQPANKLTIKQLDEDETTSEDEEDPTYTPTNQQTHQPTNLHSNGSATTVNNASNNNPRTQPVREKNCIRAVSKRKTLKRTKKQSKTVNEMPLKQLNQSPNEDLVCEYCFETFRNRLIIFYLFIFIFLWMSILEKIVM